ncbi:MAG: 23S rRNA (adenine(2503)-C(2))-methyltransferase RlmN [Eubacterium coprostanoligenes]|uniref:23S rRNA (adenine(2503)-C(2))-methyltransferase RlmN n=1 Tax=Eubacterium coprostanoligenes TaxID=290054 RepID=UPI0023F13FA8|nr:23S rRNA (adenine(2503)-C(2))-methyltransferase RlmN [Eubacterium coprostanoligenes]MDD7358365.1 23S rRNA (adenine(2503)-C(2))-methyltransferase RlmN [Eubacterium coprostanoligenes]
MTDIKSLTFDELNNEILSIGLPKFRTGQIYSWLHEKGVDSFDEMTNLSKDLREKLNQNYFIPSVEIEDKYVSKIDSTVKYLFRLYDGEYVEAVIMKYKYGYTICISSQVGCKMGCKFCASTLAGFKRNLLPAEMESQLHTAQKDLNIRISHIVLMGIGEPLDNYDNVIKFIRTVNNDKGLNISMRDITLSTCGVVPKMYDLANENIPITLTLSLHAPNDKLRSSMMPVNDKWGVDEAINACKNYAEVTGRRVSFEYTLINGVNDTTECAHELADKLKGMLCHVNLIPVNDVEERGNVRSTDKSIKNFFETLYSLGINATIRRTLGSDINASCGQLRRKKNEGGNI